MMTLVFVGSKGMTPTQSDVFVDFEDEEFIEFIHDVTEKYPHVIFFLVEQTTDVNPEGFR